MRCALISPFLVFRSARARNIPWTAPSKVIVDKRLRATAQPVPINLLLESMGRILLCDNKKGAGYS